MTLASSKDTEAFWNACNEGRLTFRHCLDCARNYYPPRMSCPHCGSDRVEWRDSSGRGTVYSRSRADMSFGGPAWDGEAPYTVILVDMDEGVRMLSRLVGHEENAKIGSRVEVSFQKRGESEQLLPYFVVSR